MLTVAARLLGDAERGSVERLLDADPYRRRAGGRADLDGRAGLVAPGRADLRLRLAPSPGVALLARREPDPGQRLAAAVSAFADMVAGEPRGCSSIVGSADAVLGLWSRLARLGGRRGMYARTSR